MSEIWALKAERRAAILAHNYQIPAIQDLADPVKDVMQAGGWLDEATLVASYQHADPDTVRRVVLHPTQRLVSSPTHNGTHNARPPGQLQAVAFVTGPGRRSRSLAPGRSRGVGQYQTNPPLLRARCARALAVRHRPNGGPEERSPYTELWRQLGAAAAYSLDHHFATRGAWVVTPDVVSFLREFSRAASVRVTIKAGRCSVASQCLQHARRAAICQGEGVWR
jgi:hypothetical protein